MKNMNKEWLNGRNILLLDHYLNRDDIDKHFSDEKFIKLEQRELEIALIGEFVKRTYSKKNTLIVFLGQSALDLKARLEKIDQTIFSGYSTLYVHAQRVYEEINLDGRNTYSVKVTIGQVDVNLLTANTYKNIIVFDDVVSSGITLKSFRDKSMSLFSNAKFDAFVLLSKQDRLRGFNLFSSIFIEGMTVPVNTFSKLTEDEDVRKNYLTNHFPVHEHGVINDFFNCLKRSCLFTPHIFCFDLYNTLIKETNTGLMAVDEIEIDKNDEITSICFHSGGVETKVPNYLDYLEESYGIKKEVLYGFVRDNLMNNKYETFEEMLKVLYKNCLPSEECTTRDRGTTANYAEFYWRFGSGSTEWIDSSFPKKLKKLQQLGHKVVLITNATYPAWKKVSEIISSDKHFDLCLVSSIAKVSKPNELIFRMAEDTFSEYHRNKFVMIGDRPEDDFIVPQKRGWQTYDENFLHQFVL